MLPAIVSPMSSKWHQTYTQSTHSVQDHPQTLTQRLFHRISDFLLIPTDTVASLLWQRTGSTWGTMSTLKTIDGGVVVLRWMWHWLQGRHNDESEVFVHLMQQASFVPRLPVGQRARMRESTICDVSDESGCRRVANFWWSAPLKFPSPSSKGNLALRYWGTGAL